MSWQRLAKSRYGLTSKQQGQLLGLLELLTSTENKWLSAVPADRVGEVHFLDSLSLLEMPEFPLAGTAVDIGSGGGIPGLPLAIARPQLSLTLIEANQRKCSFLELAAAALDLQNVAVLASRAEDAGRTCLRDTASLALARAVGTLPAVVEYALPLLRTGGYCLLQRGAREPGDGTAADQAASLLGGALLRVESVSPFPGAYNLHIWVLEKTAATAERFPRRAGMAKKRPLA